MSKVKLLDDKGILTPEAMKKFSELGNNVSCECPEQLVDLLNSVKAFTEYQKQCIIQKPADKQIHDWLKATSINLELLLSNTIINLARMEGLIDIENEFIE